VRAVAVIGAGSLGIVVAGLAARAGYEVRIAGSGDPKFIALKVRTEAPGAMATDAATALEGAEIVVLALPLHRVTELAPVALSGRVVVDATNYWAAVDGPLPMFTDHPGGTSAAVAAALPGARVVKSLNHVGAADLAGHSRDRRRIAIGVASNHQPAADAVAQFVTQLGFEPVAIGGLDRGVAMQPGSAVFGRALTHDAFVNATSG